jgi:hypothetical protein
MFPFFFICREIVVDSKHIFPLYLLQKSLSIQTVPFFFICRRNPLSILIVPYLSALFAVENIVDSIRIFLLYLPRKSLSIQTLSFFFFCS